MYIIVLYIYYWDWDFMTKRQHMDVPVKLLIRLILLSFIPICFGAIIYIALGISNPYNFIKTKAIKLGNGYDYVYEAKVILVPGFGRM